MGKQQNEVTFDFLNQIPFKNALKERLAKYGIMKSCLRHSKGDFTYFYKMTVYRINMLFKKKKQRGSLFRSNSFLMLYSFFKFIEFSLTVAAAYSISGGDWRSVIVIDALTKEIIEDTLISNLVESVGGMKALLYQLR